MTDAELAQKITDIIVDAEVDSETAFMALQAAIMFEMSCLCADCRRDVARKLKANIPKMVEYFRPSSNLSSNQGEQQ
jgi:hypothetical protein